MSYGPPPPQFSAPPTSFNQRFPSGPGVYPPYTVGGDFPGQYGAQMFEPPPGQHLAPPMSSPQGGQFPPQLEVQPNQHPPGPPVAPPADMFSPGNGVPPGVASGPPSGEAPLQADSKPQQQPPPEQQPQPPNSTGNHFLGNDRPLDKGGGGDLSADGPFGDQPQLEEHLKNQRPYSCEVCERRFSQKCNLVTHMRLHTGERPYPCPSCDKRFTQKGNLDAHLKTHTKEKPYPCGAPGCGKRFAFRSSAIGHVKQAHPHLAAADNSLGIIEDDDIGNLKRQIKASSGDYGGAEADSPLPTNGAGGNVMAGLPSSPNNFSSGIPTPQSSLDSLSGSGPHSGSSSYSPFHNAQPPHFIAQHQVTHPMHPVGNSVGNNNGSVTSWADDLSGSPSTNPPGSVGALGDNSRPGSQDGSTMGAQLGGGPLPSPSTTAELPTRHTQPLEPQPAVAMS